MSSTSFTVSYTSGSNPTGCGDITVPGPGSMSITFNLSTSVPGAKFTGIRLQAGTSCPTSTTIYGTDNVADNVGPFTAIKQTSDTKLTMTDTDSGTTTWAYSVGVTDGPNSYWDDPKIYNRNP